MSPQPRADALPVRPVDEIQQARGVRIAQLSPVPVFVGAEEGLGERVGRGFEDECVVGEEVF